jgi:hypothetical protein
MKRVGQEYPHPRVNDGRRKLWLRDDLDQAIANSAARYLASRLGPTTLSRAGKTATAVRPRPSMLFSMSGEVSEPAIR